MSAFPATVLVFQPLLNGFQIRLAYLFQFALLQIDKWRADLFVMIGLLAFKAGVALIAVDLPLAIDRHGVTVDLADVAAFAEVVALDSVDLEVAGDGECGTQWAEIATEKTVDKDANAKQRKPVEHQIPLAGEDADQPGGLERLHFSEAFGHLNREKRDADQRKEDHIAQPPQHLMHPGWKVVVILFGQYAP